MPHATYRQSHASPGGNSTLPLFPGNREVIWPPLHVQGKRLLLPVEGGTGVRVRLSVFDGLLRCQSLTRPQPLPV